MVGFMLNDLSTGLIAIFNGLLTMLGGLLDLRTILVVAIVVSLGWIAATEIEELDRMGAKPAVRRH
jgi:hypothetical protein